MGLVQLGQRLAEACPAILPMPPAPLGSALGCCPTLLLLEGSGCQAWWRLMGLEEGDDLFTPGTQSGRMPSTVWPIFLAEEKNGNNFGSVKLVSSCCF